MNATNRLSALGPVPGLQLAGLGTCLGPVAMDNRALLAHIGHGTSDEHRAFVAESLEDEHGLVQHHFVAPPYAARADVTILDLLAGAADAALADAQTDPAALDALIVATSSPARFTTPTASVLAHRLGAAGCAFDVRSGCAGGLLAVFTGAQWIAAGAKRVLVVAGDTFSRVLPTGKKLAALHLADGAAAVVLTPGPGTIEAFAATTLQGLSDAVGTKGPMPPTADAIAAGEYRLAGDEGAFADGARGLYAQCITAAREKAPGGIDLVVPHQTSAGFVQQVMTDVALAHVPRVSTVHQHANIGAAGVLYALSEARRDGRLDAKGRVLLCAVGGGVTGAAMVLRP